MIYCIECSDSLPTESRCPCKANGNEKSSLICPKCIQKRLRGKLFKRSLLQKKLSDMRQRARVMIENDTIAGQKSNEDLDKLQERVEEIQGQVNEVVNRTNSAAVSLASATVSNDEEEKIIRESQNMLTFARTQLRKMQVSTLADFCNTVERTRNDVQIARYMLALDLFKMYRLDIAREREHKSKSSISSPSGVGKISGLPLPHAGIPLYGVLPRPILISALRLVASLTAELSRVLHINLPHPFLLHERDTGCPSADMVRKNYSKANPPRLPDMDALAIENRIKLSTTAVILETPRSRTSSNEQIQEYELQPPEDPLTMAKKEEFEVGLQLLQHNIIFLCMSIGVSPGDMCAAEAVLLNLNECKNYLLLTVGPNDTKMKD